MLSQTITEKLTAPYGTWESPITADVITKNANTIEDVLVDSVTSTIYHIERRPSEKGRSVLVETLTGKDPVGPEWNVRTGVQEYGGSPALIHNRMVYFSNYTDGRTYKIDLNGGSGEPEAITPSNKPYRYANFALHPTKPEILVAVLEDHKNDTPAEIVTSLCLIHIPTATVKDLASGADFYALPRFSPDGAHLAWSQWSHPDMPWQGGEIHVATLLFQDPTDPSTLEISNPLRIAGQKGTTSACYPLWLSDTTLLFTSDTSGFVNPWKFDLTANHATIAVFAKPIDEDFAEPFWSLGMFPYVITEAGVLFTAIEGGRDTLYFVSAAQLVDGGAIPQKLKTPYVSITGLRRLGDSEIVFAGQKADSPKHIVKCSLAALLGHEVGLDLYTQVNISSGGVDLPASLVSQPQAITLQLPDAQGPLHIVFYSPHNPRYSGSNVEGEKPPCIVNVHGGPTSHVGHSLDWRKQYFISRGWAWIDVNYRGSSGYGRAYTERLNGSWGVTDVQDCIQSVRLLSSAPFSLIDPKRAAIRGGSAGGYTALAAISVPEAIEDRKVFAAAQASYGISNLQKLEEFTHKFESQYLNGLIGGTSEEFPEVYKARSPIYHVEQIETPLLILQGEIDMVVPKAQAELIYEGIKKKGGVVEYKLYPGEGHGWRREENLKDSLERELSFYERVLGLKKAN